MGRQGLFDAAVLDQDGRHPGSRLPRSRPGAEPDGEPIVAPVEGASEIRREIDGVPRSVQCELDRPRSHPLVRQT